MNITVNTIYHIGDEFNFPFNLAIDTKRTNSDTQTKF